MRPGPGIIPNWIKTIINLSIFQFKQASAIEVGGINIANSASSVSPFGLAYNLPQLTLKSKHKLNILHIPFNSNVV